MGASGNDTARCPHDTHISAPVTATQSLIAMLNELQVS
jgi:hypothetical protein